MNNKKTIKEFADELGISKNKMNYQVSKLNTDYILKLNGIKYLTNQAQEEIRKALGIKSSVELNSNLNSELNTFKHQIKQLENQLISKDEQINKLHELLDQQQQLHLKVQQDLTQSLENNQQLLEEKTKLLDLSQQKRWWQFWK